MIFTARSARATGAAFLALSLAHCAPSQPDAALTADQAARAACRQQTEQSYKIRNRADMYRVDSGRDAPLSGSSLPTVDSGLSDRYSYERDYQDCLRSRGARQTPTSLPAAPNQPSTAQPGTAQPGPAKLGGRPNAPAQPAAPVPAAASQVSPSDLSRPPAMTP